MDPQNKKFRINFNIINRKTGDVATAEEISVLLDATPPDLFISWPSDGIITYNNLNYNASINISAAATKNYYLLPAMPGTPLPKDIFLNRQKKINFFVEVFIWCVLAVICFTCVYHIFKR